MPLRAVIFDLGHTLWDFAPSEASRRLSVLRVYQRLEETFGAAAPPPKALDRALAETLEHWFTLWRGDRLKQPPTAELIREALRSLDVTPSAEVVHELTTIMFGSEVDMPVVEPDTLWAVARLHQRGLAMGCVTNTILLEEGIVDALRRLGLLRYLRSVVVSSAAGYWKPHPSLFLRALDEVGAAPGEAVFVGDRLRDDVGGAQGVGIRAVLTHQYRQEELDGSATRPDAVIRRLGELPDALQRIEAEM